MLYRNAWDASREETNYYPMTYVHPNGDETKFDLQQIRYEDGRTPQYLISESPDNRGPGFENPQALYGASHQGAYAALALNHPAVYEEAERPMRPSEINLYQQMPDGHFDRVSYREIGQDGRPNTDIERQQNDGTPYPPQESDPDRTPVMTEAKREPFTRGAVEKNVDAPLRAPEETLQQREASLEEQWRELSGPAIDRAAEKAILEGDSVIYAEGAEQPLQLEHLPQWIEYKPQEPEPSPQRQIEYFPDAPPSEQGQRAEPATESEQSAQVPQSHQAEQTYAEAQSEQAYPEPQAQQEAESDQTAQGMQSEPEQQEAEPDPAPQTDIAEQALAAQQSAQAQEAARRAQEQSQQMNQQEMQHYQSQQF